MSDAMTASIPVVPVVAASAETVARKLQLQLLGEADAASCEGDFCEIPAHHEQAVMNRRVDSDLI